MFKVLSTVRAKIIMVLLASMIIALVEGGFGLRTSRVLGESIHNTYANVIVPIGYARSANTNMLNIRVNIWRALAEKDPAAIPKIRDSTAKTKDAWLKYYSTLADATPQERQEADEINTSFTEYFNKIDTEVSYLEKGDYDTALTWEKTQLIDLGNGLAEHLRAHIVKGFDKAKTADDDAAAESHQMAIISTILLAFGVLLSIVSTVYMIIAITRPLDKAMAIASNIAEGNLVNEISYGNLDITEFKMLLESMRTMQENLTSTINNIRAGCEEVTVASEQIAAGNQELSTRTEQQAASVEETAATMTELAETVKQNADNARQANTMSTNSSDLAHTGREAVDRMVTTMREISADSQKISDITGLIEEIAFQTNLLSLNAAIEAARAGESGRGFAVVAKEVRTLAHKVSDAAKNIKELIETSSTKVHHGTDQANEASATMAEVAKSITMVSDIVAEISAACDEQSTGIDQMHQAIQQIDSVTQQNAALVEEASAAAMSLQEQSEHMRDDVNTFKLV